MKKILLLLMLIPTFSYAERICSIVQFIEDPSRENDYRVPYWRSVIKDKISKKKKKKNDVLELTIWPPKDKNSHIKEQHFVAESLINGIAAEKCNFNKSIIADTDGLMFNLVCVIK